MLRTSVNSLSGVSRGTHNVTAMPPVARIPQRTVLGEDIVDVFLGFQSQILHKQIASRKLGSMDISDRFCRDVSTQRHDKAVAFNPTLTPPNPRAGCSRRKLGPECEMSDVEGGETPAVVRGEVRIHGPGEIEHVMTPNALLRCLGTLAPITRHPAATFRRKFVCVARHFQLTLSHLLATRLAHSQSSPRTLKARKNSYLMPNRLLQIP